MSDPLAPEMPTAPSCPPAPSWPPTAPATYDPSPLPPKAHMPSHEERLKRIERDSKPLVEFHAADYARYKLGCEIAGGDPLPLADLNARIRARNSSLSAALWLALESLKK